MSYNICTIFKSIWELIVLLIVLMILTLTSINIMHCITNPECACTVGGVGQYIDKILYQKYEHL